MVTKEILIQYADLQQECKELREKIEDLEQKIEKIEKEGNVVDKVKGGEGGLQSFRIEGVPIPEYSRKKTILSARKAKLSEMEIKLLETLNEVEEFISTIEYSRMRRIINLKFIENLSWLQVANRMGGGNTESGVKSSFHRYMNNVCNDCNEK